MSDGRAETAALAERHAHPRLRLIGPAAKPGDGAALRLAFAEARQPLLCYAACHPDYRPVDLQRMLDLPMDPSAGGGRQIDHVHLISGYRAGRRVPLPLRLIGWLWRAGCIVLFSYSPPPLPGWLSLRRHLGWLAARIVFGLRYRDLSCPFRLLRREALSRAPLQSDGSFAHVELLAKVNFLGCVLGEEMPLDVRPGPCRRDPALWREARQLLAHPDFTSPPGAAEAVS